MPEIYILDLVISLIITVTVYSLPIVIVRYAILKHPIEKGKAKIVTIIYAICGFIIMAVIEYSISGGDARVTGGGLILWSYVNYKMLIGGKDKRKTKSEKAVVNIPTQTANNALTTLSPILSKNSGAAPETKEKKAAKTTYCKKCGSLIDNKTKKCEGCGKQYFHLPRITVVWCLLALLVLGLTGLNVYQYINYQSAEISYQSTINDTEKKLDECRKDWFATEVENGKNQLELSFWDNNAVLCTTEGYRYHHYGCSHLAGREYYIFNIEYAEWKGYTPCLDCCGG